MIRNYMLNQNLSGGCIAHFVEYDGYLFIFDTEGYLIYHHGYGCRLGSDEFWDWWYDDRADFIITGREFSHVLNDSKFRNKSIDSLEGWCKTILRYLINRDIL